VTLLNIVALESPADFLAAVQSLNVFGAQQFRSEQTLRNQFRTQLQQRFGEWSDGPYRAIPVARLRSSGRVEKVLSLAEPDDLFLSHFRWSATAGEYGRLQVENAVDKNGPHWSIPGNFQLHGTYSFQRDLLLRAGSVLLMKSYASITAVSALDQKVLWSRTFPYVATAIPSSVDRNFDRLNAQQGLLPSQKLSSSFQVVGTGHGWLALTNGTEFSMIEIYSGRTKWSMPLPADTSRVVASDTNVWVTSGTRGIASFSADDGRSLPVPQSADESVTLIRNVGNLLVCWKQSAGQHDPRLQWLDASTHQVIEELDLGQMQQFYFVDDNTLVGFNKQHQAQVVELRSRVSQTLTYTPTDTRSAPEVSEAQDVAAEDLKETDVPLWDPRRMQLASDGLHYYLCNRRGKLDELARSPANRHLMIFTGDLIALDRQSGDQRWRFSNRDVLMATVDQPELPIMVLLDAARPLVMGQPSEPNTFQGISKLAGQQLFEQALPMQSNLQTLSIDSPAANVLDVGVQGLRVRFEALASDGSELN